MTQCIGPRWRTGGLVAGWYVLICNLVLIGFLTIWLIPAMLMDHAFLQIFAILVLNLLFCISWLYGTYHYKPCLMLLSLIWWAVPTAIFVLFIGFVTLRGVQYLKVERMEDDHFPFVPLLLFSMNFVGIYIVAVLSYISVKNSGRSNSANDPRPNVAYSIAKGSIGQNDRHRIYPSLPLEA